ncbi:hypothetical protein JRO89_XS09G0093600 [Xanthoceras sorbifolium]|uniref:Tf2-1-like SH3-like domain-containing protein n=1 Tax=Xanthoceras sorbifolium TaxID=99658 RepID=A0ABQ8HKX9_9ROSI|nr:hypothetical protein JRO89_XS09G0093600 [Xanthoceras sorbifolium]
MNGTLVGRFQFVSCRFFSTELPLHQFGIRDRFVRDDIIMLPRRRANQVLVEEAIERDRVTQLERQVEQLTEVPEAEDRVGDRVKDIRRWESGIRTEVLEFHRSMQPQEFLKWIGIVEEILEFKRVPEREKVALVATRLRDRVAAWCNGDRGTSEIGENIVSQIYQWTVCEFRRSSEQSKQGKATTGGFWRFGYGETGHKLSECPRPAKKVLFIDHTEFNEEDAKIGEEPQSGVEEVAIEELVDGDTGTMLIVRRHNVRSWDLKLSQAEFAYNHAVNKSSGFSLFQVVYSMVPRSPIDLLPLPSKTRVHGKAEDFVHSLQEVHKQVQENLSHSAERYKQAADKKRHHLEFDVGHFVWAVLTKDRFAVGEYNKLAARKIGPLEILEKINQNAYRLKLPTHIRTHDVFNIKHLIPFYGDSSNDKVLGNSRSNFLQPGENDAAAIDDMALEFIEGWDRKKTKEIGHFNPTSPGDGVGMM